MDSVKNGPAWVGSRRSVCNDWMDRELEVRSVHRSKEWKPQDVVEVKVTEEEVGCCWRSLSALEELSEFAKPRAGIKQQEGAIR
jgi:hypothetical protein